MPVAKITLAENYAFTIAGWAGEAPSELFWWKPNLAPDTVVQSATCHVMCKKLWASFFGIAYRELPPCIEHPDYANVFNLNNRTVFNKPCHVTLDRFEDGKAYMSRERNCTQIVLYKTGFGNTLTIGGIFDVWVEIEYTGGAPNPDIIPATEPTPETKEEMPTSTFPWSTSTFLGELSPLIMILAVVLVLVLIISAIRRS